MAVFVKYNLMLHQWFCVHSVLNSIELARFDTFQLRLGSFLIPWIFQQYRFQSVIYKCTALFKLVSSKLWSNKIFVLTGNLSRIWKTTDGWNYDFEIRHAIYSRYGSANMFCKIFLTVSIVNISYDWLLIRIASWIISSHSWF